MVSQDSQPRIGSGEREEIERAMKFSAGGGVKRRKTLPLEGPSVSPSSSSSSDSHAPYEEDFVCDQSYSLDAPENCRESLSIEIDRDVLDCSICYERLSPPVFQCQNGHIACSSCCQKLKKCHSCSCPIGLSRCLALEKVLESIRLPCTYASNGCKETYSHKEKRTHEETCIYSPCSCPICDCTFKGYMKQLPHHFRREHGVSVTSFGYNSFFRFSVDQNKPIYVLRGLDGVIFLLLNDTTEASIGNALTVTCFQPRSPKTDLSYELVVRGEDSTLRFDAPVTNNKQWNGVLRHPLKEFLLVPRVYRDASGKLELKICIRDSRPSSRLAFNPVRFYLS